MLSLFFQSSLTAQTHCKVLIFVEPDFCNTDNVILHASAWNFTPPVTFLWSTGETTMDITVPGNSGTYSVTITDSNGCTSTHSVNLNDFNFTYFLEQYGGCPGEEIQITTNWNQYTIPGNYTYQWSNGGMTSIATVYSAGNYSVTITDPDTGCSVVLDIDVIEFVEPMPNITGPNTLCLGQSIELHVDGGPFSNIYWFPGGWDTETVTITEADIYIVTVYTEDGCLGQDTFEVFAGGFLPELDGPLSLCDGQDGDISVINESFFTDFIWSNGGTNATTTVTGSGTYMVTVTDIDGCMSSGQWEILPQVINLTFTATDQTNCNPPDGSIDITLSPPDTYTFLWSNGATTEDVSNLPAGDYQVTVTGSSGCVLVTPFSIMDDSEHPVISYEVTPATCGQSNGSINITVAPPGSYTYLWSNGMTTEDISDLSAGTFVVTVTNSGGCTAVESVVVTESSPMITVTGIVTDNTSCVNSNGGIDVTVSPPATYVFIWSNGQMSEDIADLNPGEYLVTVTDADGCHTTASFFVENNTVFPDVTHMISPEECGQSNGGIDLEVTPPGSYNFLWSNGMTQEDLTDLEAGTYTVTVTGAGDCSTIDTSEVLFINNSIFVAADLVGQTNCTSPNGSIDLSVSPPGSYTFLWTNGMTTEDVNGLEFGDFSVTITDDVGCQSSYEFMISDDRVFPLVSHQINPSICGQSNGSIDLTVNPPGAYLFLWSNGMTTEDITALTEGTYQVTVTSVQQCISMDTAIVGNVNNSFQVLGLVMDADSCTAPNGSIDITMTPPGSYTFLWSNGSEVEDLGQVSHGDYSVTVTGPDGCVANSTFTVGDGRIFPMVTHVTTPSDCNLMNGSIDLSVSPSSGNTFLWSNGMSTEDISNLNAGIYIVTVTGSGDCMTIDTSVVTNINSAINVVGQITHLDSCTSPNGQIHISVNPPGTYTFLWSNGSTGADLEDISFGTYNVTITNTEGCQSVFDFTVEDRRVIPMISHEINPADCGMDNGSIHLEVNPGGMYSFTWSNGMTTEDITEVPSGLYMVTVTGSGNCSSSDTFRITNVDANIQFSSIITHENSCLSPNGSIGITVSPPGNYTYLWSNGSLSQDMQNLTHGEYSVTVMDEAGCSSFTTFIVDDLRVIPSVSSVESPSLCLQNNGSIDLTVNPVGTYTFIWSNGETMEDIRELSPGIYTVTVTGTGDCFSIDTSIILDVGSTMSVSGTITHQTSCTSADGGIDITIVPAGNYTFSWSGGQSSEDLENIIHGDYSVTVTDESGCRSSAYFTVDDQRVFPDIMYESAPTTCGQNNGSIDVTVNPAGSYSYRWSNGMMTEDIKDLDSGIFVITVTGSGGCSSSDSILVLQVGSVFSAGASIIHNTSCTQPNGAIDITMNPAGSYRYEWVNGATTEDLNFVPPGQYKVTITDINSCSIESSFEIKDSTELPGFFISIFPSSCQIDSGYLEINPMDNLSNFEFDVNGNTVFEELRSIIRLPSGSYSIIIRNKSSGCFEKHEIIIPPVIPFSIQTDQEINMYLGSERKLSVQLNGITPDQIDTIIWSDTANLSFESYDIHGLLSPTLLGTGDQEITIKIWTKGGCVDSATIRVNIIKDLQIRFPNIINTKSSGGNDVFYIYAEPGVVRNIIEMRIYDRWGNKVFQYENFQPNNPSAGWNGTFNDQSVTQGVFIWLADIEFTDGTIRRFYGDVTVIQ